MLDTSESSLYEEFQNAFDRTKAATMEYEREMDRLVGDASHIWSGGLANPTNHAFEFLSVLLPEVAFDQPRVRSRVKGEGADELKRQAIAHGVNRWIRDTNYRDLTIAMCIEMSMCWGVTITRRRPEPGNRTFSRSRMEWPVSERVDPRRFFMDSTATSIYDARLMGHLYVRDKEDLLRMAEEADEDDGWDVPAIRALKEDVGFDHLLDDPGRATSRGEVVLADMWLPEIEPDKSLGPTEGFYGALCTVAVGQGGADKNFLIRKPVPAFVSKYGPYNLFGAYKLPGIEYPLAPLAVTRVLADELNNQTRAAWSGARRYRRVVFVNKNDMKSAREALSADHYVVPVDFRSEFHPPVVIELGGVSDQQLRIMAMLREQLERTSGLDSAQRGQVDPDGTATAHAIADRVADTRMAFIKKQFVENVNRQLYNVAFYMAHDFDFELEYDDDGLRELQEMGLGQFSEGKFRGGVRDGESFEFDALELEIDTLSMERTSEAIHRSNVMQGMEILTRLAPVVRQFPEWDWKSTLSMLGDAINVPTLGDALDTKMARQLMGLPAEGASLGGVTPQMAFPGQTIPGNALALAQDRNPLAGQATGGALAGGINAGG